MISLKQLQEGFDQQEYRCQVELNLYDAPSCTSLATQAAVGRHLQFHSKTPVVQAMEVRLCEDGYSGWLPVQDLAGLELAATTYQPVVLSFAQIQDRLPGVMAFTKAAMQQPNYYLWGGTVGPNYDCSGLMQAAFAASGIWLPRDSYQQEAFTRRIEMGQWLPGDLVFFGSAERVNHVGLYLGDGYYIHSSGKTTGRNGIAIDQLSEQGDAIAQSYYQQFKSTGRVERSYQPSIANG